MITISGKVSDTVANNTLDLLYGSGAQSGIAPATYYIALSTTAPTNTGTNVTEPPGNGYTRVSLTNNSTSWPAASGRVKANGTLIQFPTATGDWGTVGWVALYGAATAGTFYGWSQLTSTQSVVSGGALDVPIGALTILSQ